MSEKFVVGQWVTWRERPYRIDIADDAGCVVLANSGAADASSMWLPARECVPFLWQVGKAYRTTLDGVTATIATVEHGEVSGNDSREDRGTAYWVWDDKTGELNGCEPGKPHLLPYLADEPPPVAEAATFSEFAEVDECDPFASLRDWAQREFDTCQHQATLWNERGLVYAKMIAEIERAKR